MKLRRAIGLALVMSLFLPLRVLADAEDEDADTRPQPEQTSSGKVILPPPEGSPKLSTWPREVPRNFARLWDRKNLETAFLGGCSAGFAFAYDDKVADHIRTHPSQGVFGTSGKIGNALGNPGMMAALSGSMLAVGYIGDNQRLRRVSFGVTQSLLLGQVLVQGIKYAVKRDRPENQSGYSFPSGHAQAAFAWPSILDHEYGHKVGIPAYGIASFIALSRIEQNKHFLSDVVAGGFIGYICSQSVRRGIYGSKHETMILPLAAPDGGGIMIGTTLESLFKRRHRKS